jgi:hypothetical protein
MMMILITGAEGTVERDLYTILSSLEGSFVFGCLFFYFFPFFWQRTTFIQRDSNIGNVWSW